MKILRSLGRKVTPDNFRTKRDQATMLPWTATAPSSFGTGVGRTRKFYHALQILSLLIITFTLIMYQVTVSGTSGGSQSELSFSEVDPEVIRSKRLVESDSDLDLEPDQGLKVNSAIVNPTKNVSATTWPAASSTAEKLENVFISVKSTKRFHSSRLRPILKTWFNLARDQTWIFTDDDDPELQEITNGHIINTHCPSTHYRQALCCKMGTEFDTFIQTDKSWFCHVDDDNYLNVPGLLDLLGKYSWREYWYLGKPSLKSPIRIKDPDNHTEEVSFWFATGGAGFCISRALALRMSPLASGGKFMKVCDRIQLPDDVTVGYIAGHLLGQNLTVIPQFHSHFETMKFIDMKTPGTEITFSYVRYAEYENILEVPDGFSQEEDPTRFLSLHCLLFPNFSYCPGAVVSTVSTTHAQKRRRR